MSLIIFMLLVIVVLAVGVRILDGGSKIGLAIAVLVAVALGFQLVSHQSMGPIVSIRALAADEGATETRPDDVVDSEDAAETVSAPETTATVTDAEPVAEAEPSADAAGVAGEADVEPGAEQELEVEPEDAPEPEADQEVDADATLTAEAGNTSQLEIEVVALPGKPIIPPRPEWVETEPVKEDDSRLVVVSSGPQDHLGECPSALDAELEQAVAEYVDEYLGQVYGDKFKASTFVSFPAEYIRDELVTADRVYDERIQFSFGPMYQSHAQVAFTPAFRVILDGKRVSLDRQWERIVVSSRLTAAAIVFGLILAMLVVVSGYFRLDTATRGFYTARLQFLATVAILAVIVAGVLLAKNVHYM